MSECYLESRFFFEFFFVHGLTGTHYVCAEHFVKCQTHMRRLATFWQVAKSSNAKWFGVILVVSESWGSGSSKDP